MAAGVNRGFRKLTPQSWHCQIVHVQGLPNTRSSTAECRIEMLPESHAGQASSVSVISDGHAVGDSAECVPTSSSRALFFKTGLGRTTLLLSLCSPPDDAPLCSTFEVDVVMR